MSGRTVLLVNKFLEPGGAAGGVGRYLRQERAGLDAAGWTTIQFGCRDVGPGGEDDEPLRVRRRDFSRARWDRDTLADAVSLIWNREAARKIAAVIRRDRPDVAHLHNIYHHLTPSILPVLRRHGVPVVMTVHDLRLVCPAIHLPAHDADCPRCLDGHYLTAVRKRCVHGSRAASLLAALETWHQRRRRLYLRYVDLFLCPSEAVITKLVAGGFPRERLHRLANAVDLDFWQPDAVGSDDGSRGAYAFVGRLSAEKDLATLLHAHARWPADQRLPLLVIGDGPGAGDLRRQAAALALADVTFLGQLEPTAVRSALRTVRFTVIPSTCHENQPLAVLESLACGIPVVAARVGGLPEIVREGETGTLFQPGDADDLGSALVRASMMAAPAQRAARRWACDHADLRTHLAELADLLAAAAGRPRA